MTGSALLFPPAAANLPTAVSGNGIRIVDDRGREWLDGCSGAIACNLGHGSRRVREAMIDQADRIAFAYRTQFRNAPAEALAHRLVDRLAPGGAVMFCNSGSEAVEATIRLARSYWAAQGRPARRRILSRLISYHGSTQGALAVSGHVDRRRPVAADLPDLPAIPAPYCYRCPFGRSPDDCGTPCATALEDQLRRIGPEHVAAFIAEPVIGAAGAAIAPPADYWHRIRGICDRHGLLLIADEVMTGLGRVGADSGSAAYGFAPDLMVLGKGLNAGFTPMSAVVVSARVADGLRQGGADLGFGHTHAANPLSAAICLAVLDELDDGGLAERARRLGGRLAAGLESLANRHAIVGDVRGAGLLRGLELVADTASRQPFPAEVRLADRLVAAAARRHLLIYPSRGFLGAGEGDAVIIAPPLAVHEADLDAILGRLDGALSEVAASAGATEPAATVDTPPIPRVAATA